MALPTGFEPVIFRVRGGRPGPLDDGSLLIFSITNETSKSNDASVFAADILIEKMKWLPPYDSNVPSSVNSGAPSPRWLDGNMMVEQRRVELRTSILQGSTAARCLPRNGAQRQI